MASESSIQTNIIGYINSLPNGRAENVSGNAQQSGRADINACIDGKTFKIEVKTEDTAYGRKGATLKQQLYLEKWAISGAVSCVVYSVDDVKYMINYPMIVDAIKYPKITPKSVTRHIENLRKYIHPSGRGKWYDVQNKRWVDISY